MVTREELAKMDASQVRRRSDLFDAFRKYATEDAPLMYKSGKLPTGCFGCQFKTIFSKWKNAITPNNEYQKKGAKKMSDKKTYKLENKATKFYFKGKVLSASSSDSEWAEWIKHPADKAKQEERKKYFSVLPESLVPKPKATKKESVNDKDAENVGKE